ncbi:OLC1v1036634C1 [Oldenlandia corymbosa var. corymbosa]|uniref:OLC1v1036634C1 n=1 Tax=Oldenlandia corymbosa var. corymbosa TaxID=529605 RepID=A0AAV1CWK3_OLDCO|nr:OLC1v1036634C1 [Oldenlandia corymbosa var. corymbosa]
MMRRMTPTISVNDPGLRRARCPGDVVKWHPYYQPHMGEGAEVVNPESIREDQLRAGLKCVWVSHPDEPLDEGGPPSFAFYFNGGVVLALNHPRSAKDDDCKSAGWDYTTSAPELYRVDGMGVVIKGQSFASGSGFEWAYSNMEKYGGYSSWEIELVAKSIVHVAHRTRKDRDDQGCDLSATNGEDFVSVYLVGSDGWMDKLGVQMDTNMDEHAQSGLTEENPATKKVKNREETFEIRSELFSFKAAVLNSQGSGKVKVPGREPAHVNEDEVIHSEKDGIGSVMFLDPIHQRMKKSMGYSIVVSPLGWTVTYGALIGRLDKIWNLKGEFKVTDQVHGHYVIRLSLEEDCNYVLLNGPWTMGAICYLRVYPWTPKFDAKSDNLTAVAAWIRIQEIPLQYFHEAILRNVVKSIGSYIKADEITLTGTRGKYARIAIQLDLVERLKGMVGVDGASYKIEYQDLPLICFAYGMYGHKSESCPTFPVHTVANSAGAETGATQVGDQVNLQVTKPDQDEGVALMASSGPKGFEAGLGSGKTPNTNGSSTGSKRKNDNIDKSSWGPKKDSSKGQAVMVDKPTVENPPVAQKAQASKPVGKTIMQKPESSTVNVVVNIEGTQSELTTESSKNISDGEKGTHTVAKLPHPNPKINPITKGRSLQNNDQTPHPVEVAAIPPNLSKAFPVKSTLRIKVNSKAPNVHLMEYSDMMVETLEPQDTDERPSDMEGVLLADEIHLGKKQCHERLDRVLANDEWIATFSDTLVKHLTRVASDHSPLLIRMKVGVDVIPNRKSFRYLAAWESHKSWLQWLRKNWCVNEPLILALQNLEVIKYIMVVPPPQNAMGEDRVVWSSTASGRCTTASAFQALYAGRWSCKERKWEAVWKWQGPEKIKMFLWLFRKALLVNAERCRRHMTEDGSCHICGVLETKLHVFHDCTRSKWIWQSINPSLEASFWEELDLQSWILSNLLSSTLQVGFPWKMWFATACWKIWTGRNEKSFDAAAVKKRELLLIIRAAVKEIAWTNEDFKRRTIGLPMNTLFLSWKPPPVGSIKINMDGAIDPLLCSAVAGGVFRDSSGNWQRRSYGGCSMA